ncbi:ABC transporter ATP-binding protein [Sorangium sp. So ce131]|uniref:ABC transporter ATP-binding protein n=1 Tax=Sorangium sp. So ce131 TaxID=3133282 RepID=UPI003F607E57
MLQRGPFGGMGAAPPQKAKRFAPSARRLLGRLAPERARLAVVIACSLVSVGLGLTGPKLLGRATDIIFSGVIGARLPAGATKAEAVAELQRSGQARLAELVGPMDVVPGRGIQLRELAELLLLVMALYAGASLFAWLQGYLLNKVVQRTVRQLRAEAQDKLARLPLAYFDGRPHGELLSRVTNDVDNIAQGLQQTLTQIMNGALTLTGIVVMLVVISPVLAVITLFTVPMSVITTAAVAKRAQAKFAAQWAHVGALNGQIEEAFTGHALVNVLGRRRDVEARFQSTNQELFEASFRAQFISSTIMPAVNFVGNLTYVAIAVVGGLRVASGAMLLGSVQAFIQYSRQFSQQLGQLASVANVLQSGVASAERVFELLDEQDQPRDATPPAALPKVNGEVRFEHVTFRYKPDEPLIEDLDLTIMPGQTVAIVGPTGAGKTTLVNLLMRFYELDGGRILIDGVDVARLPRHELRAKLGIVLQDTWLFSGTIRDNIAFGNAAATEADIQEAARAAHVDRFVRALPAGYDTVINEESGNLSAGEKQLITIARAFLANPAILILDEATSSVDTRTEVLVQRAMAALRAQRTSFVIAHRLSTIRDADMLLVMNAGRIVERGTHAELLAAGGAYHALYQAQLTGSGGSGAKLEG